MNGGFNILYGLSSSLVGVGGFFSNPRGDEEGKSKG